MKSRTIKLGRAAKPISHERCDKSHLCCHKYGLTAVLFLRMGGKPSVWAFANSTEPTPLIDRRYGERAGRLLSSKLYSWPTDYKYITRIGFCQGILALKSITLTCCLQFSFLHGNITLLLTASARRFLSTPRLIIREILRHLIQHRSNRQVLLRWSCALAFITSGVYLFWIIFKPMCYGMIAIYV